jgi:hypothetical protein
MFSFLLIFACGGDSNSLPTASDLYESAESIMPHEDAIEAGEDLADSLKAGRVDFISIKEFAVNDKACSLGFDGLPIDGALSQEACAESEEVFAKRLKDWSKAQAKHPNAPKGAKLGGKEIERFIKEGQEVALRKVMANMPTLLGNAAKSQIAGLPETPWDCVEDYLETASEHAEEQGPKKECEYYKQNPTDEQRLNVAKWMATTNLRAQQFLDYANRKLPATVEQDCSGSTVTPITELQYTNTVLLNTDTHYAFRVFPNEKIMVEARPINGTVPTIEIKRSNCGTYRANRSTSYNGNSAQFNYYAQSNEVVFIRAYSSRGSDDLLGKAQLTVSSNGSGVPQSKRVQDAKDFRAWYQNTFGQPQTSFDLADMDTYEGMGYPRSVSFADESTLWDDDGLRKNIVDKILLGSSQGEKCIQAEYYEHESIVQTMVWDDAISACETQMAAALSEVHAMGKPRED